MNEPKTNFYTKNIINLTNYDIEILSKNSNVPVRKVPRQSISVDQSASWKLHGNADGADVYHLINKHSIIGIPEIDPKDNYVIIVNPDIYISLKDRTDIYMVKDVSYISGDIMGIYSIFRV